MNVRIWRFNPVHLWATTDDGLKTLTIFAKDEYEETGMIVFEEKDQLVPTTHKSALKPFDPSGIPIDRLIAIVLATLERLKDESPETIEDIVLVMDAELPDKTIYLSFVDRPTVTPVAPGEVPKVKHRINCSVRHIPE